MNRRLFIQKMLLLSGTLTLAFKNTFAAGKDAVKGKVTAAGKPLANVLISDGYSIVQTGKDGFYQLVPDKKAEFVFVIVPSGYEFPHEKQIAKYYKRLEDTGGFDFNLIRLKQPDNKHSFIVWADPQVKNKKDVDQMLSQSVPDTVKTIKELSETSLVHGIAVGDLVWDNHDLFPMYNEAVARMGIPFFQGLGNHDEDYRLGDDETSDRTFKKFYGPTYYSFNRGRAHYVMLDDVRYLGTERDYDGYIVQQQMDWLEKDLKYVDKNALLLICLHIPVYDHVKNNQEFYQLLKPFKNVHILSGHTHYNENNITGNVYEHNHGTVCGAWWTGPVCEDGTPRGYGVYQVDGNQLKWYYKSVDEDKNHQIAVYIDDLNEQKRLTANVWNWDPAWKVEYWLDNQYKGVLKNEPGLDPLTVKLYKGPTLPAARSFAEPRPTNHLFVASFGTDVKQVKVVATDRFGNKYESATNA
ncbi:MAG: metallophosphoesterase [Sphingobacteriaceae bacterium]|nr:MAG: metallophosphoesterase [Sphingobacteriaceae bacterium]